MVGPRAVARYASGTAVGPVWPAVVGPVRRLPLGWAVGPRGYVGLVSARAVGYRPGMPRAVAARLGTAVGPRGRIVGIRRLPVSPRVCLWLLRVAGMAVGRATAHLAAYRR